MITETEQCSECKTEMQTVVPADQARLYEPGWEVIGYREDSTGRRVADIRKRLPPVS